MNAILSLSKFRKISLKAVVAASICLSASLYMQPARSIPVFDFTNFTQNLKNFFTDIEHWGETTAQYGKEVAHFKSVMDHYTAQLAFWQQQLNKLRNFNFTLFQYQQSFPHIADDYGVDVMCPGSAGSSIIDKVTNSLVNIIQPNADIVGQQQAICVKLVMTQNSKYNDTVEYLDSLKTQTQSLEELTEARLNDIGDSPGNTEGLLQETQRFAANMQLSKENWETRMHQYDVQLDLLKHQQTILAKRAMNGAPSVWGTLVNTAALQGALTLNK